MLALREIPELAAALRPNVRVSPFRLLDIRCPNGHRIAEVLGVLGRQILVGSGTQWTYPIEEFVEIEGVGLVSGESLARHARHRRQQIGTYLDTDAPPDTYATFQCRCREARPAFGWVRDALTAGRRDVVYSTDRWGGITFMPQN